MVADDGVGSAPPIAIGSCATGAAPALKGPVLRTELPGPRGRALLALSAEYEPRSMTDQVPLVWQRAERCWVEDADENVFLDFTSGVVVANAGHSHPRLVAAMREQADQVVNCYDFPSEWRVRLAQKLVEITPPNLDKAVILTTGAETTEAAIKMARLATGRYEIISFHGGFHGRTFGAMTIGGRRQGAGTRGYGPFLPGVRLCAVPLLLSLPVRQHAGLVPAARHRLSRLARRDGDRGPGCCGHYRDLSRRRRLGDGAARLVPEAGRNGAATAIYCSSLTRYRRRSAAPASSSVTNTTTLCPTSSAWAKAFPAPSRSPPSWPSRGLWMR